MKDWFKNNSEPWNWTAVGWLGAILVIIGYYLNANEYITSWRYRHALMAHRMIGRKTGTGGSSGYSYIRTTVERHKVVSDFTNLTTFFIPRSSLPFLPKDIQNKLGFYYSQLKENL